MSPAFALGAQTATDYRARVDSLNLVAARAQREQVARDSIARTMIPADTVRAGSLTILTDPARRIVVGAAAVRANEGIERTFGKTPAALTRTTFVAISPPDATPTSHNTLLLARLDARGAPVERTSEYADEESLTRVFERRAAEVMTRSAGSEVAPWLNGELPIAGRQQEWRDARVELVTARAVVAHDCFRGDVARCASALQLRFEASPLLAWYDAAQRREYLTRAVSVLKRPDTSDLFAACLERKDDVACATLSRDIRATAIGAPLGQAARRSLVLLAFEIGGVGAYDRLAHASGSMEARLALAAGVSSDSLLHAWQRRVTETRGADGPLTTSTAVASLCWVTLCALLALRSSRWR